MKEQEKIKVPIDFTSITPIELEESDSKLIMTFDSQGKLVSQVESKDVSKIYRELDKTIGRWNIDRIGKLWA